MNEKAIRFFKSNIGYFMVGIVSALYIVTAFITIDKTGKSVTQVLADSAIIFFLGLFINRILELQGMMNGDRDERVQSTIKLHCDIVLSVSAHIDRLDAWCEMKNAENLKVQRTKILAGEGMRYSDYFLDDGEMKPYEIDKKKLSDRNLRRNEIRRKKCYRNALKVRLTPLSAGTLTSEGGRSQDPFYLGRTKMQYETKAGIKDIFRKLAIAGIFGYYGVGLLKDFDVSALIWTSLQVGIFLLMGVIKMFGAYMYVVDEFRGRIIKKIDNLQKFQNYINSKTKGEY